MAKGFDCPGPHEVDLILGIEADRVDPLPVAPSLLAQEVSIRLYALPLTADHCAQFILRKSQARVVDVNLQHRKKLRVHGRPCRRLRSGWHLLGSPPGARPRCAPSSHLDVAGSGYGPIGSPFG